MPLGAMMCSYYSPKSSHKLKLSSKESPEKSATATGGVYRQSPHQSPVTKPRTGSAASNSSLGDQPTGAGFRLSSAKKISSGGSSSPKSSRSRESSPKRFVANLLSRSPNRSRESSPKRLTVSSLLSPKKSQSKLATEPSPPQLTIAPTIVPIVPAVQIVDPSISPTKKCPVVISSILPNELVQYLGILKDTASSALHHPALTTQSAPTSSASITALQESRLQEEVLLLDCRPFLAFNMKHITGSFNVNCTGISKKRLQQGKTSLVDLVTSEDGRELFKTGGWSRAVVYDESTASCEGLPASHPVKLVMSSLSKQGKESVLLSGGLKGFAQTYANLISGAAANPSLTETSGHPTASSIDQHLSSIDHINSIIQRQPQICPSPDKDESNPKGVRATKVLPFLFLGNSDDAADGEFLGKNAITYILNLTTETPNTFESDPKYRYQHVKIEDNCKENVLSILQNAVNFIDDAQLSGTSILIHCRAGVSRSPTVTIAYLMMNRSMTLKEAYDFVKDKRPCVAPNLNFMGQLLDLEKDISAKIADQQRNKPESPATEGTRNEFVRKLQLDLGGESPATKRRDFR